jgi:acyl carrier protein
MTSVNEAVVAQLQDILVRVLGPDAQPVTLEARLIEDYDANSMDLVEIADIVEQKFAIVFPTEDLKLVRTVSDLVQYVGARTKTHAR